MCWRVVQTTKAVHQCAQDLGMQGPPHPSNSSADEHVSNYNMSPGMDAWIIYQEPMDIRGDKANLQDESCAPTNTLRWTTRKSTWGLVPRSGSAREPIPEGMNIHFSNLMFNARSDTLYEKATFSKLARQGQTCLVALDGFFEWKEDTGPGKSRKQPYHVRDLSKSYLLMAGLWATVSRDGHPEHRLNTFSILTTEACKNLEWLHTRMPVCIWDLSLARAWLEQPSKAVLERVVQGTRSARFESYTVTKDMSSMKFRSADSIRPLPKVKTVDSFFAPKRKTDGQQVSSPAKRPNIVKSSASTPSKPIPSTSNITKSISKIPSSPKKKNKSNVARGAATITHFFKASSS